MVCRGEAWSFLSFFQINTCASHKGHSGSKLNSASLFAWAYVSRQHMNFYRQHNPWAAGGRQLRAVVYHTFLVGTSDLLALLGFLRRPVKAGQLLCQEHPSLVLMLKPPPRLIEALATDCQCLDEKRM